MRIAVLTNAYPPDARGGAGRIAFLQVEALRAQGHEVCVWVTSLEWTSRSVVARLWVHLRDLWWTHPHATEIRAWKPEVLLTHNLTGAGFATPKHIQADGVRWVHVLHDVQLFYPPGLLRDASSVSCLERVVTFLRRPVFGRPDALISPTQWLLDAHARRGWGAGSERSVIPNPAPNKHGTKKITWGDPVRILCVSAQMSPEKGSEVLRGLMKDAPRPVAWRIIGKGASVFQEAPRSAGSSCKTSEEQTADEILTEMSAADLLLVPSQIEENQPTVLLEAFACGLPVVAQAKGGIPETLGTAGLTVASNNPADWWQTIEALFAEPRAKWASAAETAWERHAPESVVKALSEVLRSNKKI